MKYAFFLLFVSSFTGAADEAPSKPLTIGEAAAACLSDSILADGEVRFYHLDTDGKPHHPDKSVYALVNCEAGAAEDYLKAASAVYDYVDEPAKDVTDPSRRVFAHDPKTGGKNTCYYLGPARAKEKLWCTFTLSIPGKVK